MIKRIIIAAIFAVAGLNCFAQNDDESTEKKYNHYIGFQANELLKQLINLNGNSSVVTNPYLLTYSMNSISSGWGFNVGLGVNYQDSKDKNTPVARESKINDLFYRIGFGRKTMLTKRFEVGYSLDISGDSQSDKTSSSSVNITQISFNTTIIDSSFSVVTTKTSTIGFGPQLYIGFYLTSKVILGTETTYYFSSSTQKQNVSVTTNTTDNTTSPPTLSSSISNTNVETDISKFNFSFPVALFLMVKF